MAALPLPSSLRPVHRRTVALAPTREILKSLQSSGQGATPKDSGMSRHGAHGGLIRGVGEVEGHQDIQ